MSNKESNLTTITASDLNNSDYVRIVDGNASRKITVAEFLIHAEDNIDVLTALPLTGGTLTGDVTISHDSTPSLTIAATGTSSSTLKLTSASSSSSSIEMGDITDPDIGKIVYSNGTNALTFTTNTSLALTIDNAQNLITVGDLTIGGGNITNALTLDSTLAVTGNTTLTGTLTSNSTTDLNGLLTCKAITVDASSTLDMGANKLTNLADPTVAQDAATKNYVDTSFYQQGTWTPVLSDGTYTATATVEGYYERVGDLVTFRGHITVTSLGSMVGTVRVAGLPFNAIASTNDLGNLVVNEADNFNVTAIETVTGLVVQGSNYAELKLWDLIAGTSELLSTELTATSVFSFGGSYRAV